jgi:outer membrane immunogenic protein
MKKIVALALASTVAFATPALAQDETQGVFSGPRVSGVVGFADDDIFGTETFTYGGQVGVDHDLGNAVVGLTAEYQDSDDSGADISAMLRAGPKVGENLLVYGAVGYSRLGVGFGTGEHLNGLRLAGGLEFAIGEHAFVNVEQRYTNYEQGVDGFQTVAGVGFRF